MIPDMNRDDGSRVIFASDHAQSVIERALIKLERRNRQFASGCKPEGEGGSSGEQGDSEMWQGSNDESQDALSVDSNLKDRRAGAVKLAWYSPPN